VLFHLFFTKVETLYVEAAEFASPAGRTGAKKVGAAGNLSAVFSENPHIV
jgi:hypothetical protein